LRPAANSLGLNFDVRIDAITVRLIVESIGNPPAAPFFPFSAKACHFSTSVFPESVCNFILTPHED
jgi:hypothetical protein